MDERECQTFIVATVRRTASTKTSRAHARRERRAPRRSSEDHPRIRPYALCSTRVFVTTQLSNNLSRRLKVWDHLNFVSLFTSAQGKPRARTQAALSQSAALSFTTFSPSIAPKFSFLFFPFPFYSQLAFKDLMADEEVSVIVYMFSNFILLVAVSLLSTKLYHSLTMTRPPFMMLVSGMRWTSLSEAAAPISWYLYTVPNSLVPGYFMTTVDFIFKKCKARVSSGRAAWECALPQLSRGSGGIDLLRMHKP